VELTHRNLQDIAMDKLTIACQDPNPTLASLEILSNLNGAINSLVLNQNFLGGHHVRLKNLRLVNIRFGELPDMPLLQSLSLSYFFNDLQCKSLRRILSRTPNVISLHLEDPFDDSGTPNGFPVGIPDISRDSVLHLPSLTRLRLVGEMVQVPQMIQLFAPPDNEVDFEVKIYDASMITSVNHDAYAAHVSRTSPLVRDLIAQYLSCVCHDKFELLCNIEPAVRLLQKRVSVSFRRPPAGGNTHHTLSMRFPCNIDLDLSSILNQATTIHIGTINPLARYVFPGEISGARNLETLSVSNLIVGSSMLDLSGDMVRFEHLLSEHMRIQDKPIFRVILRYPNDIEVAQNMSWPSEDEQLHRQVAQRY
jgi:hypothetical protein